MEEVPLDEHDIGQMAFWGGEVVVEIKLALRQRRLDLDQEPSIDQNIYAALSLFSNGPVKDGRLPIKFKKKIY